jgi:hypothetical protein
MAFEHLNTVIHQPINLPVASRGQITAADSPPITPQLICQTGQADPSSSHAMHVSLGSRQKALQIIWVTFSH